MLTIQSYLYDNIVLVQISDPTLTSNTRDRSVYNRTIKIYKNRDNILRLKFLNQDQKSTDVSSTTILFYLNDSESETPILTITPTVGPGPGDAMVVITKQQLLGLDKEFYNYSISYQLGDLELPAYVDDNYGAFGEIQVLGHRTAPEL